MLAVVRCCYNHLIVADYVTDVTMCFEQIIVFQSLDCVPVQKSLLTKKIGHLVRKFLQDFSN